MKHFPYTLSKEVEKAITAGKAIVALETTIISHGMPYPQNFNTALEVESIIKNNVGWTLNYRAQQFADRRDRYI